MNPDATPDATPQPNGDEEDTADQLPPPATVARLALTIGQYALKYGSVGGRVEEFLQSLVLRLGYSSAHFVISNAEIFASISKNSDDIPLTSIVPAVDGE